MGAIIQQ